MELSLPSFLSKIRDFVTKHFQVHCHYNFTRTKKADTTASFFFQFSLRVSVRVEKCSECSGTGRQSLFFFSKQTKNKWKMSPHLHGNCWGRFHVETVNCQGADQYVLSLASTTRFSFWCLTYVVTESDGLLIWDSIVCPLFCFPGFASELEKRYLRRWWVTCRNVPNIGFGFKHCVMLSVEWTSKIKKTKCDVLESAFYSPWNRHLYEPTNCAHLLARLIGFFFVCVCKGWRGACIRMYH